MAENEPRVAAGTGVHLSHPDKVFYSDHELTRHDLANYNARVRARLDVAPCGRSPAGDLSRPAGSGKPSFFKNIPVAAGKRTVFIDYLRNGRAAAAVAPYSTRAKPGATVTTPIAWDQLTAGLRCKHFTIEKLPVHRKLKKDPRVDMAKTKQATTAAS